MASLREYFDNDFNMILSIQKIWNVSDTSKNKVEPIIARISQDFEANAKYWSFFIPAGGDIDGYTTAIFHASEVKQCILGPEGDSVYVEKGFYDYSERTSSKTIIFTKRIILYVDEILSQVMRQQITQEGLDKGYFVIVRDKGYALKRSELEKPLAFISHDSRDKDGLVRELVHELSRLMCPVWYDEYSLNVGDSLRLSIESGLKETKKCVVILSPSFLNNNGWGKAEFDSVYTREILQKENVILPVWHNVSVDDIYQYSPRLADKVGLNSQLGVKELAIKLSRVIKQEIT